MSKLTFEKACEHRNAHLVLGPKGLMDFSGALNKSAILKLTDEQQEMLAFTIEHWGEHVVCDYLQLNVPSGRLPGGNAKDRDFNINSVKEIKMPAQPIEVEEYLKINWDYKNNGRWYRFLEDETIAYQKRLKEDIAARKKRAQQQDAAKRALESGLSTLVSETEKKIEKESKETKTEKKVYVVTIDSEVEQYVGAEEDFNKNDYLFTGTKKECNDYVTENTK